MKDILITVISILLTVVIIICMVKGLTVGSFRILSISNIKQESLNLDNEVDELNNLKNVTYKKKIDDLQTATKYLTTAKQKYLDLASVSSDEEIQEILSKTGTAEEKVEELLEMALSRGGRDNVTMILAQINGYEEKNPLKRWAERHSTGR